MGRVQIYRGKVLIVGGKVATHERCCCGGCEHCNERCPHNADTNEPGPVIVTVAGTCEDPDSWCVDAAGEYTFLGYMAQQGVNHCYWWWEKGDYWLELVCVGWYATPVWQARIYYDTHPGTHALFGTYPVSVRCKDGKLSATFNLPGEYKMDPQCEGCTATVTIPEDPR